MLRYDDRFKRDAIVQAYDEQEYRPGSYASFIWSLQQPRLRAIVERQRARCGAIRLLDFACGTGRILSSVEGLADASDGVDISPVMVERAARRCTRSRLFTGHGHAMSLRHFAVMYRRAALRRSGGQADEDVMLAEMGLDETRELFRSCGFSVAQYYGFGILPEFVSRTPLRALARAIDRAAAATPLIRRVSIDLLFVCVPSRS